MVLLHCNLHLKESVEMSSIFWLLRVESGDFSQAEEGTSACKAEQIYKMTTIFPEIALGCLFV